jgi:hypothetical protein
LGQNGAQFWAGILFWIHFLSDKALKLVSEWQIEASGVLRGLHRRWHFRLIYRKRHPEHHYRGVR